MLSRLSYVSAIVTNNILLDDLNTRLKELLPKLLEIETKSVSHSDRIYEKVKNRYLNGSDIVNEDNAQGFIDVSSVEKQYFRSTNFSFPSRCTRILLSYIPTTNPSANTCVTAIPPKIRSVSTDSFSKDHFHTQQYSRERTKIWESFI